MPDPHEMPDDFVAPIQPTGFGVADLEIAREQDALAEGEPVVEDDVSGAEEGAG